MCRADSELLSCFFVRWWKRWRGRPWGVTPSSSQRGSPFRPSPTGLWRSSRRRSSTFWINLESPIERLYISKKFYSVFFPSCHPWKRAAPWSKHPGDPFTPQSGASRAWLSMKKNKKSQSGVEHQSTTWVTTGFSMVLLLPSFEGLEGTCRYTEIYGFEGY